MLGTQFWTWIHPATHPFSLKLLWGVLCTQKPNIWTTRNWCQKWRQEASYYTNRIENLHLQLSCKSWNNNSGRRSQCLNFFTLNDEELFPLLMGVRFYFLSCQSVPTTISQEFTKIPTTTPAASNMGFIIYIQLLRRIIPSAHGWQIFPCSSSSKIQWQTI